MAFVDDDHVEKTARDMLENLVFFVRAGDGLIQAEVNFVGWVNLAILDFRHDRAEGLEVVDQRLVDENVSVCQKQDSLDLTSFPQPPDNLKCRVGLAGACRHDEQHAFLATGYSFNSSIDCFHLIVTRLFARNIYVVGLNNKFFFAIFNPAITLVAIPQFLWWRKRVKRKLCVDIGSGGGNFVMGSKGVAI